jgi:hypothetical protein
MTFFCEQDFDARDYKGLAAAIPAVKPSKHANLKEKRGFCIHCVHVSKMPTF